MDSILIASISVLLLGIIARIIELVLEKQCKHDWEIMDKGKLVHGPGEGPSFVYGKAYGSWYISKCKHCGKLKQEKFK